MNIRKSFKASGIAFLILGMGGGILTNSCQHETLTGDSTTSNAITVEPSGTINVIEDPASGNYYDYGFIVTAKAAWDYSITYHQGANEWIGKASRGEDFLNIAINRYEKADGVVFDSNTATLEIFLIDYPEIRKAISIVQEGVLLYIGPGKIEDEYTDQYENGLKSGFDVPNTGHTYHFYVYSNFPLEIIKANEWIDAEISVNNKEERRYELSVTVQENSSAQGRDTEIKIGNAIVKDGVNTDMYKSIIFRQGESMLSASLSSDSFEYYKGTACLTVNSGIRWSISSDADWIKCSKYKGDTGKTIVDVHIEDNMSDSSRPAKIIITSEDGTIRKEFDVSQKPFDGIRYTTTDGARIMISENNISKHLYENGEGRIALSNPDGQGYEIATGQFNHCSTLKTITLPDYVTGIGNAAFSECTSLETFNKKESSEYPFESFGSSVFFNCISLKEIRLPTGITELPVSTFENCTSLHSVSSPDIVSVGKRAFYGCTSLYFLDFNGKSNVIENALGEYSFYDCKKLEVMDISGATEIPQYCFYNCTKLHDVTFGQNLTKIDSYAFSQSGLTEIVLPDNLQHIGFGVFSLCTSLERVTGCLDKLNYIGRFAFHNNPELVDVRLHSETLRDDADRLTISREAFNGCPKLTTFMIYYNIPPKLEADIFGKGNIYGAATDNISFSVSVYSPYFDKYKADSMWNKYKLSRMMN